MMQIPYQQLPKDTLIALIEAFVLREGTDYGEQEVSLEKKVNDIFLQIQSTELVILFNPEDESFNIVNKRNIVQFMDS